VICCASDWLTLRIWAYHALIGQPRTGLIPHRTPPEKPLPAWLPAWGFCLIGSCLGRFRAGGARSGTLPRNCITFCCMSAVIAVPHLVEHPRDPLAGRDAIGPCAVEPHGVCPCLACAGAPVGCAAAGAWLRPRRWSSGRRRAISLSCADALSLVPAAACVQGTSERRLVLAAEGPQPGRISLSLWRQHRTATGNASMWAICCWPANHVSRPPRIQPSQRLDPRLSSSAAQYGQRLGPQRYRNWIATARSNASDEHD